MSNHDDANDWFLSSEHFLGTDFRVLGIFIGVTIAIGAGIGLYFLRREGLNSLGFKLIAHVIALMIPIGWIGLSIGSNLAGDGRDASSISIAASIAFSSLLIVLTLISLNRQLANHVKTLNDAALTVAQGNLRAPEAFLQASSRDIFSTFYRSFVKMLEELQQLVRDILSASIRVAGTAQEIAASSTEVSSSSTSISGIMEKISQGASRQVQQIIDATEAEKELEITIITSFQEIFESLELVQEISEETNLLALNASIEAQRAGEAGRGFAIVAQNVRRLSDDSRTYADEILNILNQIEAKIKQNHKRIADSISEIRVVSEDVAAASEEVSASAEEQAATLQEMTATTQELATLANQLEETVKKFKIE
ncbi:MAG: hypothetical protein IH840_12745 [Candidatus Heimdallarchaeota archaeon]|nr:hypothetical protein [Candidatus Heimdallarchaeota archaeon]